IVRAAGCTSLNVVSVVVALAGLTSTATRTAAGTSSRRSSSRFVVNSAARKLTPVRFPPGRARLATRRNLTGSWATAKPTGIVVLAALAAKAGKVRPVAAMTATCRRPSSAANSGSRSGSRLYAFDHSRWQSQHRQRPVARPEPLMRYASKRHRPEGDGVRSYLLAEMVEADHASRGLPSRDVFRAKSNTVV